MQPSEFAAIGGLVLFALLVGAAIPTLMQLRQTLRSAQRLLDETGPKIDRITADAAQAAERANRISASLERGSRSLQTAMDAVADISRALRGLRDNLRTALAIGAAVGPAVTAAARALFATDGREAAGPQAPGAEAMTRSEDDTGELSAPEEAAQ